MERGYLHSVVWIALLTLLGLLCLYWLPEGEWHGLTLRRVDLLADLRPDTVSAPADSVPAADITPERASRRPVATPPPGITAIVDMADSTRQGMEPLYRALAQADRRVVRIAVLGDSYIEGDILTGHLRELLQNRFGGCGVGFVPVTSDIAGFRRTVGHRFDGWTAHNANDHGGYDKRWSNLTGHYFFGRPGASVTLSGTRHLARLDTCARSLFYAVGHGTATVTATVNGGEATSRTLSPDGRVAVAAVEGRIGRVTWRVDHVGGDMAFLGTALEGDHGVVVDNFALRSAGGVQLTTVSDAMFALLDQARHYDLVIVMYGLNVAGKRTSPYDAYRRHMTGVLARMKAAMPATGFLVVSVADREQRGGGSFKTLPGVVSLVNAQHDIARQSGVAFWNLYSAMGGEGSIVRMVANHEANLDYTHINERGGKRLARHLYDAIVWGYEHQP